MVKKFTQKNNISIDLLLRSINHPLLFVDKENNIVISNNAAEIFFGASSVILEKNKIAKWKYTEQPQWFTKGMYRANI